jgi:hypothetical protein
VPTSPEGIGPGRLKAPQIVVSDFKENTSGKVFTW